ncbi:MAG: hypothetical protein ACLP5H_11365 [Desulfomonilaceae bacterium]
MTTGLSAIYIVLMALGLLWVISRMVLYLRNQRQIESRWSEAMYDEQFKAYLDKLKEQNPVTIGNDPAPDENETDDGDKSTAGDAAR